MYCIHVTGYRQVLQLRFLPTVGRVPLMYIRSDPNNEPKGKLCSFGEINSILLKKSHGEDCGTVNSFNGDRAKSYRFKEDQIREF